jgi:hypothetical protein
MWERRRYADLTMIGRLGQALLRAVPLAAEILPPRVVVAREDGET